MSRPPARTRSSSPSSSSVGNPWKPSRKGRFWYAPAGIRSSTTGSSPYDRSSRASVSPTIPPPTITVLMAREGTPLVSGA